MNTDPTEPKDPLLTDHEYDGIRELDNKLPHWWVWLFVITTFYAVGYLLFYHVYGAGNLQAAEYTAEMKQAEEAKAKAITAFEAEIPTLTPSTDPAVVEVGHQVYGKYCAACHRADGGGLVGPNLTDSYWIHGSKFSDNVKVIWDGVPAKGMVTWKNVLKPSDIYAVSSYVYTLRGAKLETPGKPPENQTPSVTEASHAP